MKWFKHMSNASDDEFIAELEDKFGLEGYARWFKLLEVIATQMDKTSKCSARFPWTKWQLFLKGKRKKLELFLGYCENKQRITQELNGNILEIKIPKLLKLRDNYTKDLEVNNKESSKQEVEVDINNNSIGAGRIPIPEEFNPTEETKQKAIIAMIPRALIDSPDELLKFSLHHKSKNTISADWQSEYLKWLMNAKVFAQKQVEKNETNKSGRRSGSDIIAEGCEDAFGSM